MVDAVAIYMVKMRKNNKFMNKEEHAKFKYWTKVGLYEADSFIGLLWEIFRHRLYHLIHDGKWQD